MTATIYIGNNPPVKNESFDFEIELNDQSGNVHQADPTLAAGDVKVSKDGGSYANISSLPTAIDSGKTLTVSLTADEMNADRVSVQFSDAAGDEWDDLTVHITTVTADTVSDFDETATIPDSVAADGSRPTVNQALLMLTRFLMEKSVSSTTVTVKKEDGSTSSMTFTLDDATNPTSISRAS